MKTLVAVMLSMSLIASPTIKGKTLVTKIHEDDQITVLVKCNDKVKERKIHGYDFESPIRLAEEIPTEVIKGKFTNNHTSLDGNEYYQFKSDDDSIWWMLTETEIGYVPSLEKEYVLLYCNNGTTKDNKNCDCLSELKCECEVYDDVFLGIFEAEKGWFI